MIINVRGTSGSGKTYTVRSFMERYGPDAAISMGREYENKTAAHVVYYNMQPVYFIGSYKNVCGGCDTIPTQDMACSLVRHFAQFGHVIFEGLLMSHTFSRYAALAKEMEEEGFPFIFAIMDTSLELCLERVTQRRLAKGNTKPLNPANTTNTYEGVFSTADKLEKAGFDVRDIDHTKDPVKIIRRWLKEDDMRFELRKESFR